MHLVEIRAFNINASERNNNDKKRAASKQQVAVHYAIRIDKNGYQPIWTNRFELCVQWDDIAMVVCETTKKHIVNIWIFYNLGKTSHFVELRVKCEEKATYPIERWALFSAEKYRCLKCFREHIKKYLFVGHYFSHKIQTNGK